MHGLKVLALPFLPVPRVVVHQDLVWGDVFVLLECAP